MLPLEATLTAKMHSVFLVSLITAIPTGKLDLMTQKQGLIQEGGLIGNLYHKPQRATPSMKLVTPNC